jgi:hypothetical protein
MASALPLPVPHPSTTLQRKVPLSQGSRGHTRDSRRKRRSRRDHYGRRQWLRRDGWFCLEVGSSAGEETSPRKAGWEYHLVGFGTYLTAASVADFGKRSSGVARTGFRMCIPERLVGIVGSSLIDMGERARQTAPGMRLGKPVPRRRTPSADIRPGPRGQLRMRGPATRRLSTSPRIARSTAHAWPADAAIAHFTAYSRVNCACVARRRDG